MPKETPKKQNTKKTDNQKKYTKTKKQITPKNTPKTSPKKQTDKGKQKAPKTPKTPLKIIPLGGLGEIGKNITVYEYKDDILLVDCGMAFPDEDTPGIDIVIPDFSYLVKNREKIKGLVVTHGHEDHIGAIPYLLQNINVPIYATRLTIGLIEGKLREHKLLGGANLNTVEPGKTIKLGVFDVEFIHVNHSIPDAVALAITSGAGTIVQTGDFKIDTTPIDDFVIDLSRFAQLGKKGVLALLSDSTNAERPGYTQSERIVGESFQTLFKKAEGSRIIVATFSSNIHRIQQIIDEAARCSRKVAVSGRSMVNVVNIAAEMGYLKVPDGVLVEIETIKRYRPDELVIVTTGSQGEPLSALHRMAYSDHRNVDIVPGDMIIISATPIPGNEKLVSKVINELMKRGANVVYEKMYDVHVSGHACQEELKIIHGLTRPKFFIPVHGEQKHLAKHAALAHSMGMSEQNVLITDIGKTIELSADKMAVVGTVPAGRILVDGLGVGDVGSIVLRDRKHLAEDGLIVVVATIDSVSGELVSGPDVVSRGFVYVREAETLFDEIKDVARRSLEDCCRRPHRDWAMMKTRVRDDLSRMLFQKTKRSPMILPIIMEV